MKRAEITIKLAHATGESMEEVSNWMTAIWNNFDDGTHTLTYYADVLAKLGAATASSADEIAQGLEKFAAVAETVGLSYEYAASALATITAETRQSADVVGTALKTLFSRMESLKLGDTLDDGTSLNKYSLALKTVGVDIKDASGSLKDMDMILDETAVKWETLSKD
jgi:TP901 family phage tail tape measure protein